MADTITFRRDFDDVRDTWTNTDVAMIDLPVQFAQFDEVMLSFDGGCVVLRREE